MKLEDIIGRKKANFILTCAKKVKQGYKIGTVKKNNGDLIEFEFNKQNFEVKNVKNISLKKGDIIFFRGKKNIKI